MADMKSLAVKRPVLRYHGGKWMLAPWIISYFPEHRIYVEPYGGAASVLMRKPRSYSEVYNDLDGEVVNLFRVVRDRGDELREKLRLTPFARDEFSNSYEPSKDPLEQARRTVIRSFMGFGSNSHHKKTGFRSCSNRSGTTPAHDWRNYPDCLTAIIDRLQGVVIESADAISIMKTHDTPKTLHYIDPPYIPESRDKGTDYRFEMIAEDHEEMAEAVKHLQGMVVISGYPSELYDSIFSGWNRVERAAHADGARKRTEVLWMNFSMPMLLDVEAG